MSFIKRFLDKQKDPEAFKSTEFLRKIQRITPPRKPDTSKQAYSFKHSGNCGDIIYAIPAMMGIAGGRPIHLYLNVDQPGSYGKSPHPLGNVMLNTKMVEMLRPLVLSQPAFASCEVWNGEEIDIDLDYIRTYPFLLNRGHIARWYFLVFGGYHPLNTPWLQVKPDDSVKESILIARSQRYHAPGVDYSFLRNYEDVCFIGVEQEFEEIRKDIPHIKYRPVKDFLQMAGLIAGSKLFIGNQSFPYSIAEALKVNRLLEWYFQTPNVIVDGENGFEFCFQPQFEQLVRARYAR